MKAEKFDGIIRARTKEIADEKIEELRETVFKACRKLFNIDNYGSPWSKSEWHDDYKKVLTVLASENNRKGWPQSITEDIEKQVTQNLIETLDEFTKASLAASRAAEPKNKIKEVSEVDGKTAPRS